MPPGVAFGNLLYLCYHCIYALVIDQESYFLLVRDSTL